MSLIRWFKFNVVGAFGMVVQLVSLAGFHHVCGHHYLVASVLALEVTLLHNFLWHVHFTWRDRVVGGRQFVRFHVVNGLVSVVGNVVLTRWFVEGFHLPLLVANGAAILLCSLANFGLGHRWAFASVPRLAAVAALALVCVAGRGQLPSAPVPQEPEGRLGTDCAYENVFAGLGAASGGESNKATFTGGVTFGQYFARTLGKGIAGSPQFELGLVGPLPGGHPVDGLVSFNVMVANKLPRRSVYPFATAGYSRLFVTGNAVNFGVGVDFGKDEFKRLLRVEVRDYFLLTGPRQHVLGLRIGFGAFLSD